LVAVIHDEFWTIAQRLLFFEEPASKWLHLKRWLKRKGVRPGQLTISTPGQLEKLSSLFRKLLEGEAKSKVLRKRKSSEILSTLFALEESKRFTDSVFETWLRSADIKLDSKRGKFPLLSDGPERKAWINFLSTFAPNWHLLTEGGAGASDSRGRFLSAFLSKLDKVDFKAIDWQKLSALFRRSVSQWRARLPGHFLPDLLVLVEGTTETILLPTLAKRLGLDLDGLGAMLIPAGGANQVAKKYGQLKHKVSIPIFCLLDADAHEQKILIKSQLRNNDCLYSLKEGEVEDLIRIDSFVCLLNDYLSTPPYSSFGLKPIHETDFRPSEARTRVLDSLWRERKLGKFDKVDFAKFVSQRLRAAEQISADGRILINSLAACKSKQGRRWTESL
jgi:hypothetical protein